MLYTTSDYGGGNRKRGGLFHSANMHIVEKFTRKGREMLYEMPSKTPMCSCNRG